MGSEEGRTLTEADAEDMLPQDMARNARDKLLEVCEARRRAGLPESLKRSILQAWWPLLSVASFLHLVEIVLQFIPALIIKSIVQFIDSEDDNLLYGVILALVFALVPLVQSIFMCNFIMSCRRVGMRTWGATSCLVFEKTLRLSQPAAALFGEGALTNIMQVDTNRFDFCFFHMNFMWSMPLMLVLGVGLLYREIGLAAFSPLVLMVLMYPLNNCLVNRIMKLAREVNSSRDSRVKITTEVIHAVRLVKMLAWESQVIDLVGSKRKVEMDFVARFKAFGVVNGMVWQGVPLLLPLVAFGAFIALGGELEPGKVFSSLALLDMVRIPMNLFPQALQVLVQIKVGMDRVEHLLGSEEVKQLALADVKPFPAGDEQPQIDGSELPTVSAGPPTYARGGADGRDGLSAAVRAAEFRWSDVEPMDSNDDAQDEGCCDCVKQCAKLLRPARTPAVPNNLAASAESGSIISLAVHDGTHRPATLCVDALRIPRGKLVFICGAVGSGKSTLVAGLLNEVPLLKGQVQILGPVAYCSQKPWILHGTVKDNVLFGDEDDPVKFNSVTHACALDADLRELRDGANTLIGERGINLSGGQKARIGLARAAFKHASTSMYIMDDPLSAVDMHVGAHLMDELLGSERGLLRNATRVVVTHQLQYLEKADLIIVLQSGKIAACKPPTQFSPSEFEAFGMNATPDKLGDETSSAAHGPPSSAPAMVRSVSGGSEVTALVPSCSQGAQAGVPWQEICSLPGGDPCSRLVLGAPMSHPLNRRRSAPLPRQLIRAISAIPEGGASPQRPALTRARSEPSPPPIDSDDICPATHQDAEASAVVQSDDDAVSEDGVGEDPLAEGSPSNERPAPLRQEEEERHIGALDMQVWLTYARAMGVWLAMLLVVLYLLINGLQLGSTIFLSSWSSKRDQTEDETYLSLSEYAALSLGATILLAGRMLLFRYTSLVVSRALHNKSLLAVLRTPMSWLDTTPTGRIINRFSQDHQKLDMDTQATLSGFADNLVNLVVSFGVIVVYVPFLILIIFPLTFVYNRLQRKFRTTARELQRLASRAKSPIYQGLDEAIIGVTSIRAYEMQQYFVEQNCEKVALHISLNFNIMCCNRWLCVRLRTAGTLPVAFVALGLILQTSLRWHVFAITGGLAGLVLRYALQFAQAMESFLQSLTQTELCLVAIERITSYTQLGAEPELTQPGDASVQHWPTSGEIQFENVTMRYRTDLPTVLNGISFTIPGGTSVGVVGRTGAGKSSLLQALFRMCPLDGGRILIDGVDIATLGLHTLRRRLSIIPQDPVGFTGSLRFNLDPFNERTENALWQKLEEVQLGDFVRSKEKGLDFDLTTGGENLSVGQMQLVCAARAFLRNSRILILDEATASVDYKTDALIQEVLRHEVTTNRLTTLTIAHRINTIMGNDMVLVMDRGAAAEMGPPRQLAQDSASVFYTFAHPKKARSSKGDTGTERK